MAERVYVVRDREAIEYFVNNDVKGFESYLEENLYLDFEEPDYFDTEGEVLAFCAGVGNGHDDRNPDIYTLRSTEEADMAFIVAIESR